jgi:hypothetical protein
METEIITIQNVELGSDLKGFVKSNFEDIVFGEDMDMMYDDILKLKDDDLVLVKKQINSPTKLIQIKIIDEDLIEEYI